MKSLKQFLALAVALVMALSCGTVAFAAEAPSYGNTSDVANVADDVGVTEIVFSGKTGDTSSPYYSATFVTQHQQYFTLVYASYTPIVVEVYNNSQHIATQYYPSTDGNTRHLSVSNILFSPGSYYVTVKPQDMSAVYVFQFMITVQQWTW